MTKSRTLSLAMFVGLLAAVGCGGNKMAPVKLSGKLTYKGQAIPAGVMTFHTAEGTGYDGLINTDGTYTATDLPAGEYTMTVETETIAKKINESKDAKRRENMMQKPPGGAAETPKYVKIPAKYGDIKTSPFKFSLSAGKSTKDFDLTD